MKVLKDISNMISKGCTMLSEFADAGASVGRSTRKAAERIELELDKEAELATIEFDAEIAKRKEALENLQTLLPTKAN